MTWTSEQDEALKALYPTAPWADILTALPNRTRRAIYQRARILHLQRWNQGSQPLGLVLTGKATDFEIGWLAGMVDGEGTLQLSRRHHKETPKSPSRSYLQPVVKVTGDHLGSIERAHRLMGGQAITQLRPSHYVAKLTGVYRVERVLLVLLPHLTVKAERARLLIEYASVRKAKPGRARYGSEEEALYERFYHGSGRVSASRKPRKLNAYANPELTPTATSNGDHVQSTDAGLPDHHG